MARTILRRSAASLACIFGVAIGGCAPPASPPPTFTPGSGDTLGTLSDGITSFDLQADNQGDLSRITSSAGAGFECPTPDRDCTFCGNLDEVCIQDCDPPDPDCGDGIEAFTILTFSNSIDGTFLNTPPIDAGLLPVQLSGNPAMPTFDWTGLTDIFSLEVTSGGRAVYGIQGESLGRDENGVPQFVTFAFSSVTYGTYGLPGTVPQDGGFSPLGPADAIPLTPGTQAKVTITVLFQGQISLSFRVN